MRCKWNNPEYSLPEDGELVEAEDSGGHIHNLRYERNMWWLPDRSMYVYFVPVRWRKLA